MKALDQKALEAALRATVGMCEQYAQFIRRIPAADIEQHPYLPALDDAIREAREAPGEAIDCPHCSGRGTEDGFHPCPTCSGGGRALAVAEAVEPVEDTWRDLALQFDGHRIEAMSLLRYVSESQNCHEATSRAHEIKAFLSKPPLRGEAVLADRLAALSPDIQGDGE